MQEFKLPDLGEGMHEAEIRRWLIKPGDTVKLDQPMVEVETDKAVIEIPSPIAGRIASLRVEEGTMAQLGQVLVVFDTPSTKIASTDDVPPMRTDGSKTPATSAITQAIATSMTSTPPVMSQGTIATAVHQRVLAAPAVRKRAFELGVDIEQVTPSQPSGRITLDDIQAFVEQQKQGTDADAQRTVDAAGAINVVPTTTPGMAGAINQAPTTVQASNGATKTAPVSTTARKETTPVADERQLLTGLRRRIAEHMERSWRTVPHASAFDEVDTTELVALRQSLKPVAEQRGIRLTYMPLLVKLLIPVLKEFPIFNASFDEEKREIIYKHSYHIGIAADSPEGLLVPVLRNADQLTLLEVAQQLEHLIEGAQKRTLTIPEASGSTFTLNNIGSFGGSSGAPIINYPEVAILAVGRMQEKAIVRNGAVIVRTMMPLTLTFDHRLIDGGATGKFLARFKELVEHPQRLMLDMV